MTYYKIYQSQIGKIYLLSDGEYLTHLLFRMPNINDKNIEKNDELPIFKETSKWLDLYFEGNSPEFIPKYKIEKLTPFRKMVTDIMLEIPFGKTITYNDIAIKIAKFKGIKKMSAQAVGQAVGANPICIIIPCHRVVGQNNNLTGYKEGLINKIELLKIEKHNMKNFKIPKNIERCSWCNLNNKNYIEYHDHEWGILNTSDEYLLEMLILESFQAGLSWECVLNKRETFRTCYDDFNLEKICEYSDDKITELLNNKNLIRNKLKIKASINNAKIFKEIIKEYQGFYNYLKTFTKGKIIYEVGKTKSDISDKISIDLSKRGMKFVGSTIIYSYLQAIGIIYSHDKECFMYKTKN